MDSVDFEVTPDPPTVVEVLSKDQALAWELLESDKNLFLTGDAGTGKSYLLDMWRKKRKDKNTRVRVVASTGAAAILVGGCTFHSFFGVGIAKGADEDIIARACNNQKCKEQILLTDILVIDEVSMLQGRLLDLASAIAQRVRRSDEPFGGMRIICVGDFLQLPPICDDKDWTDWAFNSNAWQECNMGFVELTTIQRTTDLEFTEVLRDLRRGNVTPRVVVFLDEHRTNRDITKIEGTRLYGTRREVDAYNQHMLRQIDTEPRVFRTGYYGNEMYFKSLENAMPIPDKLVLKKGALVMIRQNGVAGAVNGTLAEVTDIKEQSGAPEVIIRRLDTKTTHSISPSKFEWVDAKGETLAHARNFPLTLAWACTIHKSQGASIDSVVCNVAKVWEAGQAYVAISRAKDPAKLYIEDWSRTAISASEEVIRFYSEANVEETTL